MYRGIKVVQTVVTRYGVGSIPADTARKEKHTMLYWALMFLVFALVAALFGFGGIAAEAIVIGKVLFVVFLILFLISLLTGAVRPPPG